MDESDGEDHHPVQGSSAPTIFGLHSRLRPGLPSRVNDHHQLLWASRIGVEHLETGSSLFSSIDRLQSWRRYHSKNDNFTCQHVWHVLGTEATAKGNSGSFHLEEIASYFKIPIQTFKWKNIDGVQNFHVGLDCPLKRNTLYDTHIMRLRDYILREKHSTYAPFSL